MFPTAVCSSLRPRQRWTRNIQQTESHSRSRPDQCAVCTCDQVSHSSTGEDTRYLWFIKQTTFKTQQNTMLRCIQRQIQKIHTDVCYNTGVNTTAVLTYTVWSDCTARYIIWRCPTSCSSHSTHYQPTTIMSLITSQLVLLLPPAKEVMFSSLFVCLSVRNCAQKLPNGFAWNFQGKLAMGQWKSH